MSVVIASFETPRHAHAAMLAILEQATPSIARRITLVAPPPRDVALRLLLAETPPEVRTALLPRIRVAKRLVGPLDAGVIGGLIAVVVTVIAFYTLLFVLQVLTDNATFSVIALFMAVPVTLVGGIIGFVIGSRRLGLPSTASVGYEMALRRGECVVGLHLPVANIDPTTIEEIMLSNNGLYVRRYDGRLRPLHTTAATTDPRTNPIAGERTDPDTFV